MEKTHCTIKTCSVKTLAIFLSVLMIFYLIPATAYASLFEATDAESVVSEPAEYTGEIFEDINRREENVKHFRLEDGTYMAAQYDTAVHSLDENGEWQNIDNTLYESGSEYSTSNARVKFAKKITGNESIFTLHENNRKITLSLDGAIKKTSGIATNTETEFDETATTLQKMMTLDKLSSRVIYENILDGVDLEYILVSNNVKENIIVKKQKDSYSYSYSFTLKLNNLSAALSSTGDVEITDPDSGEVLYIIPAPVVYDANMTYASENDAYYTLETIGQKEYRLTVTASTAWMNASDRTFPVTIDPAIYHGGYGMQQMCDTYVAEADRTSAYGSETYLRVGYDDSNANLISYVAMRTLPTIPAGSMLTEAYINLTYNGISDGLSIDNPLILVAKKIIRSGSSSLWTESTIDYNNDMTYGDILDYRVINNVSAAKVESWNITAAAVDWYTNGTSNQGIALMQYDETDSTTHTVQFYSSESTALGNAFTPFFTIAYVNVIGIEDYYSYHTASAGIAGKGYVNTATGALCFAVPLLSTTDSLMPYTVSMTYNSEFAGKTYQYPNAQTAYSTSYMPYGFKLNINETIIEKRYTNSTAGQSTYYIWADSDGTEHSFFEIYDSEKQEYKYVNEDGLPLTLDVSPSICTITDETKTIKTFTKMASVPTSDVYGAWYLTSITDKNNNKITFTFDDTHKPIGINLTPNGGSTISFLSFVYNNDGHLSMIRNDTSEEAIAFLYSDTYNGYIASTGTKYLHKVLYVHGNSNVTIANWDYFCNTSIYAPNIAIDATATYTYNVFGQLVRVTDLLSGYRLDYSYTGEKVTLIRELGSINGSVYSGGQQIGFAYSNGYSEIRTSGADDVYETYDDVITRYVFDNNSRTVGMYSTNPSGTEIHGACAGEYQEAEKVKNNLKTSTAVGGSATNYLLNGGFETTYSLNSAPYWTTTSSRVAYLSAENALGATYANFTPTANTTDEIYQYTMLPKGTYTLSMSVSTVNCTNVQVFVELTSSKGNIITKEIPINEYYASGVPYPFSLTFESYPNGVIYCVAIRVVSGSFTDTGKAVCIDNVMLEENIGNSSYSLVQMGNFDSFAINSDGEEIASIGSYWQSPSGAATAYSSAYTLFGNVAKVDGNINSENYIKQRVYTACDSILDAYDNATGYPDKATTFTLSAFALGTAQVPNINSKFRVSVIVYYYEGIGNEDTVQSKDFYFINDFRDWQFVCGSFTTLPGKCVHYIDVICEYSYQPGGYALFDNIAVTESSDGNVVEYEYYDSTAGVLDGLIRMQKSGYNTEYYEYNSDRMVTRIANNRGEIVDYTYAVNGVDIESEIYYTFTYGDNDDLNYPYLVEDPDLVITKTPKIKTEYTYNSYGQLTATCTMALKADLTRDTSVKCITTSTSYLTETDSRLFGTMLSSIDNLGRETRYIYNTESIYTFGDLMAVVNVSAGSGTCYTYDVIGNMLTATPCTYAEDTDTYSAVGEEENVQYVYKTAADLRNLLHSLTTGSTVYTFAYDSFGNYDVISAGSRQLVNHDYKSCNGKLGKITYGNGFYAEYSYDELDNIKKVWYNGVPVYEYTYTAYGQLHRFDNLIDGTSTVYEYDPTGRLVHFTKYDSSAMVNEFSSLIYYDELGRPEDYFYIGAYENTSGVNDWSTYYYNDYLPDGRLNSFRLEADGDTNAKTANATVNFTYDKYNRLTNKSYIYTTSSQSFTGSTSYTYTETTAATSSQIATYKSTINGSTVTCTYTYDNNGFITKISFGNNEYRYVYDDLGQLKREDNTVTGKTYIYEYDDAGNITSKKTYTLTAAGVTPSGQPSTASYGYNDSWGDLLTSYNGVTISYDAIGNPLSYYNGKSYTFTWKNGRQLATASVNSNTLSFNYNDEGIRTSKTVNGVVHTYHLSGSDIIAEEWGNNLIVYLYDSNGSPIGMQYRTSSMVKGTFYTFWFEKNLQGDIVAVYNSAGTKVISYTYDAWGNCTTTNHNISGTNSYATYNPFRYRGYYYDSELGFYYLNSRYYDPAVGRFINADVFVSIGQGILGNNMFAYCRNNPVYRKDISGTTDVEIFDDDSNLLDDDKVINGGKLGNGTSGGNKFGRDFGENPGKPGGQTMPNRQGSQPITDGKTFLPDDFYSKHAPKQSTPNSSHTQYKYNNHTGEYERSTVCYDFAGRQIIRIDWTNHGYSDHGNPHVHITTYNSQYPYGIHVRWGLK